MPHEKPIEKPYRYFCYITYLIATTSHKLLPSQPNFHITSEETKPNHSICKPSEANHLKTVDEFISHRRMLGVLVRMVVVLVRWLVNLDFKFIRDKA